MLILICYGVEPGLVRIEGDLPDSSVYHAKPQGMEASNLSVHKTLATERDERSLQYPDRHHSHIPPSAIHEKYIMRSKLGKCVAIRRSSALALCERKTKAFVRFRKRGAVVVVQGVAAPLRPQRSGPLDLHSAKGKVYLLKRRVGGVGGNFSGVTGPL